MPTTKTKPAVVPASVANFLKTGQSSWKKTVEDAKKNIYKELDEGTYECQLSTAKFEESKGSSRPQIHFTYVVVSGPETGETIHKYQGLESEEDWTYLARELYLLGVNIDAIVNPSEIPQILADLEASAPTVKINIVMGKKGYLNKFLQGVVKNPTSSAPADEDEDEDTDSEEEESEDSEEEEESFEVGDKVSYEKNGKEETGEITKLDGDKAKVKKDSDGRVATVAIEDLSKVSEDEDEDSEEEEEDEDESEEEEDEAELEVGSKIRILTGKHKDKIGTVKSIDEEAGMCKVTGVVPGKIVSVELTEEALEIVE